MVILIRFSLLSSCSSFRDSTFEDQGQGDNLAEDGSDLNGIICFLFILFLLNAIFI